MKAGNRHEATANGRKTTILGLALSAVLFALCFPANAQQAAQVHHIGFLDEGSISLRAHLWEALRQRLRELGYLEGQTSDGEISELQLAMARSTDPGEQLIDGLAIEKAMLTLPPGYRTAFILHDIEGYNHGEAARLSGHAVGTSKSQLHKARASLRAMLSKRSPALQT